MKPKHCYPAPVATFDIKGLGTVRVFNDQDQPMFDDCVSVDGELFIVKGIETHMNISHKGNRDFGLLLIPAEQS